MFSKVYKFGFLIECLGYCWWTLSNQFLRLKDLIFNIDTLNAFESSQLLSRMNWSIKNCWYLNSIDILLTSSSNISTKLPNIMNWSQIYGWVWIKKSHPTNPCRKTIFDGVFSISVPKCHPRFPDKTEACECQLQGVRFWRNFVTRGLFFFWDVFPMSWGTWMMANFVPKQIGWMDLSWFMFDGWFLVDHIIVTQSNHFRCISIGPWRVQKVHYCITDWFQSPGFLWIWSLPTPSKKWRKRPMNRLEAQQRSKGDGGIADGFVYAVANGEWHPIATRWYWFWWLDWRTVGKICWWPEWQTFSGLV